MNMQSYIPWTCQVSGRSSCLQPSRSLANPSKAPRIRNALGMEGWAEALRRRGPLTHSKARWAMHSAERL